MNLRLFSLGRATTFFATLICCLAFNEARAQLSYDVTDLGTLGGANSVSGTGNQVAGMNQARMIVGSSNVADGSEHAFVWIKGQMYDLNLLCDLSKSDFKVLTVAKTIDDCLDIVGEGIATDGNKHAFLLTPTPVRGGRWCYSCCQWIWKHDSGWWWESNCGCYNWHGGPGGHGSCPWSDPPPCYWWPLPCPDNCGCHHDCLPPEWCYCCIDGVIYIRPTADCQARGGQCYACPEDAIKGCQPCHWCCVNGKVFPSNSEECRKKGGQCFGTEEDAIRNCKACWWCCLDGKIFQTTWADCVAKGGQCYPTQEEAQAHQKECVPKGWCCLDGKIFPSTLEECQRSGGQFYLTEKEALAHQKECKPCWCCFEDREGKHIAQLSEDECKRRGGVCYKWPEEAREHGCIEKLCWVCIDGKPVPMIASDAEAKHLVCYPTKEAAQNSKECAPPLCWCCFADRAGKHLVQTTQEDCKRRGGVCYDSPQQAQERGCVKLCWVCIDGRPVQIPEAEAFAKHLRCYPSAEAAKNSKDCAPAGGWCCVDTATGMRVVPSTAADCEKNGGKWYASEQDARKACEISDCWCCIYNTEMRKMTVVHTTTADCQAKGGRCFASEQEAKACGGTPPPLCWVCINGNPTQVPVAEAQAKDLKCFTSREDAARGCEGGTFWCCIDGRIVELSCAECAQRRGQCFHSKQEADANCHPIDHGTKWTCRDGQAVSIPAGDCGKGGVQCWGSQEEAKAHCTGGGGGGKTCWVCIDGQVTQIPEADAKARKLKCYDSQALASRNCKPKTCWTCMEGRVVQLPENEVKGRGLPCFNSQREAARSCQGGGGNKTCWVCINGRVGQVPESAARARGLQCFSSREEALRSCGERPTLKRGGKGARPF